MLIFDENADPASIDSIFMPTSVEYFWTLNLPAMDFGLTPLTTLEQCTAPAVSLRIRQYTFVVPARWNILVYDKETQQLDAISIAEAAGRDFTAFAYGPKQSRFDGSIISVVDYFPEYVNTYPSFTKQQMLCHPITPTEWVCIGPVDAYNKYLKDAIAGDLT